MARSDPALRPFHPHVRRWFAESLGRPSEPQRQGWPAIAAGGHTLILAPTGTGKTLAAFLWELNALLVDGLREPLPNAVQILYVSPLKALNNDVQRNLEGPLAELEARFAAAGDPFPEIRVAVRTGDTPASARARMLRKSPHVLITTPESLHILLTSVKGRGMFSGVRVVILDEIHAVAGTKRGAHLALTLERLDRLAERPPQRIGLSATQRPLEEIARYLGGASGLGTGASGLGTRASGLGTEDSALGDAVPTTDAPVASPDAPVPSPRFRPVTIIDCGLVKQMELEVVTPVADLADVGGTVWPKVVDVVHHHARRARTMLVFVNNRAQAERIAAKLNAQAEEELAQPYHGSLSRERRQVLEGRLKAGELRVLVATSSLELGIDIGSVDLVMQLQSPKRVSSGLQRVGRAGHSLGAVSRGVLVSTFRDDLVEIVAIAGAMRAGEVEPTAVPQNALDVLAQVVVAAVSVDDWTADEMFALVRGAYPYHRLSRGAFDEVLSMLSGKYPSELAAELQPRITWDRVTGRLSGSRGSRLTAVVSGGTIPDRGLYAVTLADRTRLGELDEEFVHESRIGDAFQLGSSTWRIAAIEHDRVIVRPAPGAPARMPFWHGEYGARWAGLAARVGAVRRLAASLPPEGDPPRVAELAGLDEPSVESLRTYVGEQRAATGEVPDERTVVVEEFRDELGAVRLILHSVFGGRVNAPWGMALAQRVREALGVEVQVQTTDDGIMLRLPDLGAPSPLHALAGLSPEEAERRVIEEVGATSLFGARFRMNAARALLLPRGSATRRMPLWLQRLKAADLLQTVRQFPSFPILVETYREVLQDAFDLPGLKVVLADIAAGRIAVRVVETDRPSPFAASLQFGFVVDWMYGDDTPRAERQAAMLTLDRAMLDDVMLSEGADDDTTKALEAVLAERRGTAEGRRARTADELAHLLDRAGDLTAAELRERVAPPANWGRGDPLDELLESGRVVLIPVPVASSSAAGVGGPPSKENTGAARESRNQNHALGSKTAARAEQGVGGPPTLRAGQAPREDDTAEDADDHNHSAAIGSISWRAVLVETYPRYVAAFGPAALARVRAGADMAERDASDVIPSQLTTGVMTRPAARREILSRFLTLAGPVTVADVRARYGWPAHWIEARLLEWERTARLVRGRFQRSGAQPLDAAADAGGLGTAEWCSRKLLDLARRRALAALRKQIEATDLATFASFLARWQRVDPRDRLEGPAGLEAALRQLAGLPRPPAGWERDYFRARLGAYDPAWLATLASGGRFVWAGSPRSGGSAGDAKSGAITLGAIRFFERGEGSLWLTGPAAGSSAARPAAGGGPAASATSGAAGSAVSGASPLPLSEAAVAVLAALERYGASFLADLQAATALGAMAVRDALRELVAAGLVTNDGVEALREIIRMKPLPDRPRSGGADPTRWLPADFTPSRPVVQRRANLRRLPKWRRPDLPGPPSGWVGRWSLLATPGTLGVTLDEDTRAGMVARRWLDRYGVVARDWWRRERPPVSWRAIYVELKRLEYRGEVRRGYFVRGLAGAQFALPDAVERLRAEEGPAPFFVIATSDPANPYALPFEPGTAAAAEVPAIARPRGASALLVMRAGRVAMGVEGRGRRIGVADWLTAEEVSAAASALVAYLEAAPAQAGRPRELVVEMIDGAPATASPHAAAFQRAGFRKQLAGLVWMRWS